MDFRTAFDQSPPPRQRFSVGKIIIARSALIAVVASTEAALIAAGSLACSMLFRSATGETVDVGIVMGVGVVSAVMYLAIARALKLYDLSILLAPDLRRTAIACAGVIMLLAANLVALKAGGGIARGFIVMHAVMLVSVICVARLMIETMLPWMMADAVVSGRRVVLVGLADELERLLPRDLFRHLGLSEVARVAVASERAHDLSNWEAVATEAIHVARVSGAKEFVLALPWTSLDRLDLLEQRLSRSPLPVSLLPDRTARSLLGRRNGGMSQAYQPIDLQRAPLSAFEQASKRILDILLAGTILVLLTPLLAFVIALIKIDTPGPALFHQRRNGFNQRQFVIHKFRTMRVLEDAATIEQARRDDDRITRIGRILRRTSIDELPQLFNVLRGEMSIVGPRPHALAHDEQYEALIADYCLRHHVKPGITGWAQINGLRGETRETEHMSRRVEYDLWYVSNWSLALDCWIILRTAFEVLSHDAY